jgi:hypothetical protein
MFYFVFIIGITKIDKGKVSFIINIIMLTFLPLSH